MPPDPGPADPDLSQTPSDDLATTRLPPSVRTLGWVSFFVDLSSELLYPVLPLFLATLGTPFALIGLIEGLAEVTAGVAKGYFGALSDRLRRRRAFVTAGYALSALVKPLPGLVPAWTAVLAARVLDRVGKGLRTAPRDALLAAYTPPELRGRAFGLHRAMDTAGAALGPLAALAWLAHRPGDYRPLFLVALVPALVGVALTRLVPEVTPPPRPAAEAPARLFDVWTEGGPAFRQRLVWLAAFALGNASDVFLLLRIREGVGPEGVALTLGGVGTLHLTGDLAALAAYVLYNAVFAAVAYPAGVAADRWGRRATLATGFALFAVVYAGMAFATSMAAFALWMALYGVYAALTEGVAKAWVADVLPDGLRGRGLGLVASATSLAALAASTATGVLWTVYGPALPFLLSAAVALAVALGVLRVRTARRSEPLASE